MDEKEVSEMQEEMMTVLVVEPMKAPYVYDHHITHDSVAIPQIFHCRLKGFQLYHQTDRSFQCHRLPPAADPPAHWGCS